MNIKKSCVILICASFALFLYTSCSSKKENESVSGEKNIHGLYEKVAREKEKYPQRNVSSMKDESERKKQIAVAEDCLRRYNSCLEKCKNTPCENACQNTLAVCEKDLPMDLRTIKN